MVLSFLLLHVGVALRTRGEHPGDIASSLAIEEHRYDRPRHTECITLGSQMPRLEGRALLLFGQASHTMAHEYTNNQKGMAEGDTELVASFSSTSCTWAFLFSLSTSTTKTFSDDLCISNPVIHSMRRYNQFHPISIKFNHIRSSYPVVPVFCVSTLTEGLFSRAQSLQIGNAEIARDFQI